ncbi:cytochrome c oxidase subunit 3 [Zavarzinia compransoris]|uniref:Cytochrome C oxidase subunit III n=1 Tax=Zavarzinia compransoris TaxID=1264899 RepID=A0A317EA36_9PROT|nr:cytochrome c oxidase subunit 3 [Zavarzinia compransoris]PWR22015.1 cytochrome C oxidase subunit III [Zavarzinia compransoris]TDP47246.1 nitric oxide reductase NorE protein [Zavarzinia compransoris]
MTARLVPTRSGTDGRREPPGGIGIWILLAVDTLVFLTLFGSFAADRLAAPVEFAAARGRLDPLPGLVNTLVLLTSSWAMAAAVLEARAGRAARAALLLRGAMAWGALFMVVKGFEYRHSAAAALAVPGDFFGYYFAITILHLFHVVAGIVAIHVFAGRLARCGQAPGLEALGIYWHVVDVLWLVIFPLLYLI